MSTASAWAEETRRLAGFYLPRNYVRDDLEEVIAWWYGLSQPRGSLPMTPAEIALALKRGWISKPRVLR